MVTDVDWGKVMLDVLELYGGCDDLGEFMRGFGGVLKKYGGEAGIEPNSALKTPF